MMSIASMNQGLPQNRQVARVLFALVALLSFLCLVILAGLAAGAGALLPALGVTALVVYPVFLIVLARVNNRGSAIYWVLFGLIVGLPFLRKLVGINLLFALELAVLALTPLALLQLPALMRESKGWRWFIGLLSAYLVLAVMSSVAGRTHWLAGTYQFFTNAKVLCMAVLGVTITLNAAGEHAFWRMVRWFWLPNALLVIWQWADFGSYLTFFSGSSTGGPDPLGLLPSRGMGVFHHPTIFGAAMGALFVFSAAKKVLEPNGISLFTPVAYFSLLLSSGQRQETLAVLIALALMMALVKGWRSFARYSIIATAVVCLVLVSLWPQIEKRVDRELGFWGTNPYHRIEQPRQVLYFTSFDLANREFPLGVGLGTFAGAGSVKYDQSLYRDLGFRTFSWFDKSEYLMDTYWPNFIAEAGWIGFASMFGALISLLFVAISYMRRSRDISGKVLALAAFGGVVFVLLLSPTSPAFQDPSVFLLPALMIGIARNAVMGNGRQNA